MLAIATYYNIIVWKTSLTWSLFPQELSLIGPHWLNGIAGLLAATILLSSSLLQPAATAPDESSSLHSIVEVDTTWVKVSAKPTLQYNCLITGKSNTSWLISVPDSKQKRIAYFPEFFHPICSLELNPNLKLFPHHAHVYPRNKWCNGSTHVAPLYAANTCSDDLLFLIVQALDTTSPGRFNMYKHGDINWTTQVYFHPRSVSWHTLK